MPSIPANNPPFIPPLKRGKPSILPPFQRGKCFCSPLLKRGEAGFIDVNLFRLNYLNKLDSRLFYITFKLRKI